MTGLFDAVRDLPEADARERVLQHPSVEVRREVLAMLTADRDTDNAVRPLVDVAGAMDEANAPIEIPAMVGEYKVTGLLGQGGGGVVLKGVCPRSGDAVAIKVLGIGAWSSRALGRFRQEIKLLGHLSHPGIAKILDAGTDRLGVSPHPYFVMEFVDGQSLSEWRRAAPRTPREIVGLFAEIVEAVAYSHARGITHRDLKPSNVIVTADGRAKILDFGVATVARDADPALDPLRTLTMLLQLGRGSQQGVGTRGQAATADGAVVGTLPYMSPEQISGTQLVDARSDLYSLGVMLYEALCGRLPYDLSLRSLTDAALVIRSEVPTTLGRHDRGLRGDLEVIVSRLLEKRPIDRYQSAQQLLGDLERYLRGQRAHMRRIPLRIRVGRFARRYPAYIASFAVVVCIALGSLGYAARVVIGERMEQARQAAETMDDMRRNLSSAAFEIANGRVELSRTYLAAMREPQRNWASRALERFLGRGALVSNTFYGATWMTPGADRLFIREGDDGAIPAVFDLRDRTRRAVDIALVGSVPIAISPDGLRMVRAHAPDGRLLVRAVADGIVLDGIDSPIKSIDAIDWSDDGSTLVLANRQGQLAAVDLATGAVQQTTVAWRVPQGGGVFVRAIGGEVAAAAEGGDAVFAWRIPTGGTDRADAGPVGETRAVPLAGLAVRCMDVARVGGSTVAAVGTSQGSVAVVDLAAATVTRNLEFASTAIAAVAIEPRRGLIVAGCGGGVDQRMGTLRVWDLATGGLAGSVGVRVSPLSAAFSDDGETLFVGDASGELMRFAVASEVLSPTLGGPSLRVERMAFADGGRMVVSTADGAYWWNWETDRQASRARLERWPLPTEAIVGRAFAVLSVRGAGENSPRQPVLAVVDRDSASARFFSASGAEVGRAAIDAEMAADATPSIAAVDGGFFVGAGRSVLHYRLSGTATELRAEAIGSCELPFAVRSVSSTPDAGRAVATVSAADGSSPLLVGIATNARGLPAVVWQRVLAETIDPSAIDAGIASDGSCAVTVRGATDLAVYETNEGQNIFVARDFAPWDVDRESVEIRMSSDGRALALRFVDGTVRLIEARLASVRTGSDAPSTAREGGAR